MHIVAANFGTPRRSAKAVLCMPPLPPAHLYFRRFIFNPHTLSASVSFLILPQGTHVNFSSTFLALRREAHDCLLDRFHSSRKKRRSSCFVCPPPPHTITFLIGPFVITHQSVHQRFWSAHKKHVIQIRMAFGPPRRKHIDGGIYDLNFPGSNTSVS